MRREGRWLHGGVVMRVERVVIATSLSGLLLLSSGCGLLPHGCTAIGWYEGLTLDLNVVGGAGLDGPYELELDLDGLGVTKKVIFDDAMLYCVDGCYGAELGHAGRYEFRLSLTPLGRRALRIVVTRYDEDGMAGGPQRAMLVVRQEGVEVGAASFEPDYDRRELNGAGC